MQRRCKKLCKTPSVKKAWRTGAACWPLKPHPRARSSRVGHPYATAAASRGSTAGCGISHSKTKKGPGGKVLRYYYATATRDVVLTVHTLYESSARGPGLSSVRGAPEHRPSRPQSSSSSTPPVPHVGVRTANTTRGGNPEKSPRHPPQTNRRGRAGLVARLASMHLMDCPEPWHGVAGRECPRAGQGARSHAQSAHTRTASDKGPSGQVSGNRAPPRACGSRFQ